MENFVNSFKSFGKKKYIVIIGIIGIILILLSDMIPSSTTNSENKQINYQQYTKELEQNTKNIISSIEGVGKCNVMITLDETDENVYAMDTDEKNSSGSISSKNEYVFYEKNNDDTPILIKQYFPKVKGIVVVCQGGDDVVVKEEVICAITSLFDIPSSKISVSKLNC